MRTNTNASFNAWVRHINMVHRTNMWDRELTPEEEAEDDRMNEIWNDLTERQKQRIWQISADLYDRYRGYSSSTPTTRREELVLVDAC